MLREDDSALLRISERDAHLLAADNAWWLPKHLLQSRLADLRRVRIQRGDRVQELARADGGQLELLEPEGFNIDGALAARLGEQLVQLEAQRWSSGSSSGSWGFEPPFMDVEIDVIENDRPQRYTLTVGERTPAGRYARFSKYDGVFVLGGSTIEQLDTLLIDRGAFLVNRDTLHSVRIESSDGHVTLERWGDRFESQPRGLLHTSQVEQLLELLTGLRPEAALHTGTARAHEGLARPELRILIEETIGSSRRQRTLSFGSRRVAKAGHSLRQSQHSRCDLRHAPLDGHPAARFALSIVALRVVAFLDKTARARSFRWDWSERRFSV